jgi:hypothetical protein
LAIALGSSSDLQITKLAEAARAAIERKRSRT